MNNAGELNLIDCARILGKNKLIIFLFFLAGILFSLATIYLIPKTYQAEAVVELGNMANANKLVNEINYSFSQKYPALNAVVISDGFIKIENSSAEKEDAENGVSDAVSVILPADVDAKKVIQVQIDRLKADMNKLKLEGQQIADLYLKLFDWQSQSDSFLSAKIIRQSTIVKERLTPTFKLILGAILGIFVGLVFVSLKEWWRKNKNLI